METIILKNAENVVATGAKRVGELPRVWPAAFPGLATGSTPPALYRQWVKRYIKNEVKFRQACSFNLDEYLGIGINGQIGFNESSSRCNS